MSKANAKAFLKKLMESKDLVERCRTADEQERLHIAAALGFPHTAGDMQAVIDEGMRKARRRLGELSDTELDHVAGGQGSVRVVVIPAAVLQVLSADTSSQDPLEIDL
jgi:predicted ribosomally synthesized peptide with nif11-like leader